MPKKNYYAVSTERGTVHQCGKPASTHCVNRQERLDPWLDPCHRPEGCAKQETISALGTMTEHMAGWVGEFVREEQEAGRRDLGETKTNFRSLSLLPRCVSMSLSSYWLRH